MLNRYSKMKWNQSLLFAIGIFIVVGIPRNDNIFLLNTLLLWYAIKDILSLYLSDDTSNMLEFLENVTSVEDFEFMDSDFINLVCLHESFHPTQKLIYYQKM